MGEPPGHRRKTDSDVMFRDILALMDLMPVGIRWMNRQGDCEYVNRPFIEMFGYSTTLRSMTQGRAVYSMEFDHYEEVPKSIAEAIIAKKKG